MTERRIMTSWERLTTVLGGRPPARVLLEASTESEWVARHLEALGREVIVADPNYAPMYATRSRRVKTDRGDARTLTDACRLGAYRPAHRLSGAQRHIRAQLAVRDALVRTRTRYIALVKAFARRDGLRIPSSATEHVGVRVRALPISASLASALAPLLRTMELLNEEIAAADRRVVAIRREVPVVARLAPAPSVGPLTATAFVATIDDVTRFASAHQLEAHLGLVPSERSSGEKQRRGRITNAGSARLRGLPVEAGWRILRSRRAEAAGLRVWAQRIARRRGQRVAVVALARRLAGILDAMWRHGASYRAPRIVAEAAGAS